MSNVQNTMARQGGGEESHDEMRGIPSNEQQMNIQLASQLLSAISSGLANGQPFETPATAATTTASAPQATNQNINSAAQVAGQFLLQQLGLQQIPPNALPVANAKELSSTNTSGVPSRLSQSQSQSQSLSQSQPQVERKRERESSRHRHHTGNINNNNSNSNNHQHRKHKQDRKPLFSVVPCRARGMPSDHNSSSACFTIPRDVKHGQDLQCSYPACRNAGIKFCYCAICGIPVAKRNFRQRHEHADKKPKSIKQQQQAATAATSGTHALALAAAAPSMAAPPPAMKLSSNHNHNHNIQSQVANERRRMQDAEADDDVSPVNSDPADPARGRNLPAPMKNLVFHQRHKRRGNNSGIGQEEAQQQRRWVTLLRERPHDSEGDEMSKWLLAVLEISNPNGHRPTDSDESNTDRQNDSSETNGVESSASARSSSGSGASGAVGWNSSSETVDSSGDSSDPTSSSTGNSGTSGSEGDHQRAQQHNAHGFPPRQAAVPVVSDFRNSTESPSGSTDAAGVETTTSGTNCDPTSGSGSNDSTVPREASSSLGGSINSLESSNAQKLDDGNRLGSHNTCSVFDNSAAHLRESLEPAEKKQRREDSS